MRDVPLSPNSWRLWGVLLVAVLPSVLWIAVDKSVWPWDQAWYGMHSVELFFSLIYTPLDWFPAMLNILGRQAPGIVWAGQFFVPVGLVIGSMDAGLLLSIVVAQAVAVVLMYKASCEWAQGRLWVAVTGAIAMAAAPLFIALSHYYLAEMMQTMAVAWFMLIMARAHAWTKPMTAGQLVLASSLAMAAKVSSPLFCVGPGLVALGYFVRRGSTVVSKSRSHVVTTFAFAIPLALATAAWYYRNHQAVIDHVSMAASGPVAELYGKSEQFLPSLKFWMTAALASLLVP